MNDNIASFSPYQSRKGHIKNSDPQNLKIPCCYEATRNLEVWGQVDENIMYWFVYIEILHQLSSLIVENFLCCYWLK